jgi:FKBP-type peptidyl-prolyl cis-trans isomerase SlpA
LIAIACPFARLAAFHEAAVVRIEPGSHVTLHYRLAVLAEGVERELISTLSLRPATLAIGAGQLAPALERRLIGLSEGAEASFDLAPDEAYGRREPQRVQAIGRAAFDAGAGAQRDPQPGDPVELGDGGERLCGVLRAIDDTHALVDFNHPLAGQALRFSVRVIGVL